MKEQEEQRFYRPREIYQKFGYPWVRLMELARKINRRSSDSEKGFHYLLTLEEVKQHFGF